MVRLWANVKTGTLSCERRDVFSSKNTIPGSILSIPLSLFIAGFLSSIANASRTFRSFIPVALSITRTLCQSMSCDPFLWRTCSAMADFSGWLSRNASRCSFVRTSRAFIVSPTYSSWQVSHFNTQHPFVFHSAVCPLHCTSHWGFGVGRTSISFQLPGQFVWLHSSLPQWMECELPAILPCWSLHLPRTAGAPKLSSTGLSLLSQWTSSDSHFLAFRPWCARFPPSLIFRHCKPWLGGGYQRRGIVPCVGFLYTALSIFDPRIFWTVRPWMASSSHFRVLLWMLFVDAAHSDGPTTMPHPNWGSLRWHYRRTDARFLVVREVLQKLSCPTRRWKCRLQLGTLAIPLPPHHVACNGPRRAQIPSTSNRIATVSQSFQLSFLFALCWDCMKNDDPARIPKELYHCIWSYILNVTL